MQSTSPFHGHHRTAHRIHEVSHGDICLHLLRLGITDSCICKVEVSLEPWSGVQIYRGVSKALIFLQSTNERSTRIFSVVFLVDRFRQQHPRLYFSQCSSHDQVLTGQIKLNLAHKLYVLHVLTRNLGHRNIENVEVLFADQIQQQIQRSGKGFQDHFEGIWRYIEVLWPAR